MPYGIRKIKMADDSREYLEKLSKNELVERILQLQQEKEKLITSIPDISSINKPSVSKNDLTDSSSKEKKTAKHKKSSSKREFDFKRYNKRHIALMIAYLGWDMHGFAAQENIDTTVEAFLFDALIKARLVETREECNYSRCGRTDKGVSAFRQVVSLDVRSNISEGLGIIQSKDFIEQGKGSAGFPVVYCAKYSKININNK